MKSGIVGYMNCASCVEEGLPASERLLEVGLVDNATVRIWCPRHQHVVTDLEVARPMDLRCDECGMQLGPGHGH